VRVQKSVFEYQVGQVEWARLRDRLLGEYKADEDSLRFYFLDEAAVQRTEHHGIAKQPRSDGAACFVIPRTRSAEFLAGLSRLVATRTPSSVCALLPFWGSEPEGRQLPGWRKWCSKSLWPCWLARPQSPRVTTRGAD
jgi:hypothetical protein